jgi:hypothetical protein
MDSEVVLITALLFRRIATTILQIEERSTVLGLHSSIIDCVTGIGNTHSIYWHSVFRLRTRIYVWLQFSTAINSIAYVCPHPTKGDMTFTPET